MFGRSAISRLFGQMIVKHRIASDVFPEAKAVELAEKKGFQVYGLHSVRKIKLNVNDQPRRVEVRGPLLMWRDGRHYIGQEQTEFDPNNDGNRLQVLELCQGHDVDGVILLNTGEEKIQRIELSRDPVFPLWVWIVFGAIAGGVLEDRFGWASWFVDKFGRLFLA